MTRLQTITVEQASGKTKDLYGAIQSTLGGVPNLFQGIGNSPAALEGYLAGGEALKKGKLSFAEREAIALTVSQANRCNYCLSAHSALGKMAGLKEEEILGIRQGNTHNPKIRALSEFVRTVLKERGHVTAGELRAVQAVGYNDAQITETIFVISQTEFTNFFNHVNDTVLDFPPVPEI
jgi:uncharacterized peroxidase-related enzyme